MQETKLRLGREGVSGPESPRLHCYDQGAVNAIFAGGRFPVGVGQEFDRAAALGKPIVAKASPKSPSGTSALTGQEDPQWVGDTTAVVQPWWSRSRSFQGIQGMASVPWSVYQLLSSEYDDWHYAPEPVTDGDVVLFSNVDAWKTFLESSQEPRRLVQAPRGLEQYGWRSETVRAAPAGIMQFWRSRLIQLGSWKLCLSLYLCVQG